MYRAQLPKKTGSERNVPIKPQRSKSGAGTTFMTDRRALAADQTGEKTGSQLLVQSDFNPINLSQI